MCWYPRGHFCNTLRFIRPKKFWKFLIYRHAPIFSHWSWWAAPPCTPLLRFMMFSSTFFRVPALVNRISGLPAFLAVAPAMYLECDDEATYFSSVRFNTCKIYPPVTSESLGRSWTHPYKIIWETAATPEIMSLQTNLDRQDNIIRKENFEESTKVIIFTWLDGTLMKPSTASAKTPRAEGIWSIRESDDVSKLTPEKIIIIWL